MALSGDLIARGFSSEISKKRAQESDLAEIRQRQKNAFEQILFREKLKRETDEINRQAKLEVENTKASRKESLTKETKQRLAQAQLISAAGGTRNLSTNFGREDARGLQRATGVVDTSPLNFNQVVERQLPQRFKIRQQPQVSESLQSKFDNIQIGTPAQRFAAANEFRETRGARLIKPKSSGSQRDPLLRELSRIQIEKNKLNLEDQKEEKLFREKTKQEEELNASIKASKEERKQRHKEQLGFSTNRVQELSREVRAMEKDVLSDPDELERVKFELKYFKDTRQKLINGGLESFMEDGFQLPPEPPTLIEKAVGELRQLRKEREGKIKRKQRKVGRFEIIEE